jgi:hypothetical protein
MKKKKDIFVKSSVHAWNPKPDKEQLKDWAKMLGKTLKNKNIVSRGTHYHYVNSKPRLCASASAMPVIVLSKKQQDKFFKKKVRKKK